jgi:hypothetical protein
MSPITTGLIASILSLFLLSLLFLYEERKGVRFLGKLRVYADIVVLKTTRAVHSMLRFVGRDFVRQVFHYASHQVLRFILFLIRRVEEALRNAIRVNKTLAKSVEEERDTRTKLEEIAFHKAANALSDEEKKEHKDRMLQGF